MGGKDDINFFHLKNVDLQLAEQASHKIVRANKSTPNPEVTEDGIDSEYCPQEFSNKKSYEEHISSSQICKTVFKEPPHYNSCLIRYYHEEYWCDNSCEYFKNLVNIKDHTQLYI